MNRLYDRNFLIAFLAQTAFTITNSMIAHYARWISFLGGSPLEIGQITSTATIVGIILRPVIAPWIDRAGPRACWCVASAFVMASLLANPFVSGMGWQLYVLRTVMSVGIAVVFASGLTYIAQTTPADRRTEAIGVLGAGGFAGLLFGPWLGDLFLGGQTRGMEQFIYYFATAALGVGLSVVLVLTLRRTPIAHHESASVHPMDFFRSIRRYWPGSIIWVNVAFGVCMCVIFVFLADFVDRFESIKLWWFFVTYATVGLSLRLSLRTWPDQFGPKRVLVIGMAMFAVGMLAFTLVSENRPWWILLPGVICGAAHGLTFHSMVSLSLEHFPPHARGAGSTLALLAIDIGTFTGSQLLGWVAASQFGYEGVFRLVAVICVLSTSLFLMRPLPSGESARHESRAPTVRDATSPIAVGAGKRLTQ